VTIDPRRGVVVSVPLPTRRGWAHPDGRVESFLAERERWIRRHLARHEEATERLRGLGPLGHGAVIRFLGELHEVRVRPPGALRWSVVQRRVDVAGPVLEIERAAADARDLAVILEGWARDQARHAIGLAIDGHAEALAVTPRGVSIRDPRSRWGSASRNGRLSFSWRLVLAPPEALETVVVHELAHLRVFGHGPRFWAVVASRRPDHAAWRRWLRDHSLELHSAFARDAAAVPTESGAA
jgi:predicted metal-dependent hydrolase